MRNCSHCCPPCSMHISHPISHHGSAPWNGNIILLNRLFDAWYMTCKVGFLSQNKTQHLLCITVPTEVLLRSPAWAFSSVPMTQICLVYSPEGTCATFMSLSVHQLMFEQLTSQNPWISLIS